MTLPDYAFTVDDKSYSGVAKSHEALADMESSIRNVVLVAQDRVLYRQRSSGP